MYNPRMILEYLLSLLSFYLVVTVAAGVHVLLYKRDSRAALGWLGLIFLFPIAGAVLYVLFGVNRVHRKARRDTFKVEPEGFWHLDERTPVKEASIRNVGFSVTGSEPNPGNTVSSLYNGEQAFPPMLEAIGSAKSEVLLSTYIFDNDETGLKFIDALAEAKRRGVQISVLVDDVGIRYCFPTIIRQLKAHKLPFKRFMRLSLIPPSLSLNLRTHRKLLIVDREIAFAGGMNIGDRQLLDGTSPHRASDLHFRIEGPVIASLVDLFEEDWCYSGGQPLQKLPSSTTGEGPSACRLISDGPDETLDSLQLGIMGVISRASRRVWIMTPYFLPDRKMMACLQAASLAGVDIRVMIPMENNWPLVQWALQHNMAELLSTGVEIMQRPPPFAHSKCLLVDDDYTLVGSSNLDPRSLRLNFELGIEVFDRALNEELSTHFSTTQQDCIPFTNDGLNERKTLSRLRDATSALFAPYL